MYHGAVHAGIPLLLMLLAPALALADTVAIEAAQDKQAGSLEVLDLRGLSGVTDFFLICDGTSNRQVQAIVEELKLPTRVYSCRAEEVLQLQTFDTLVARGVAALSKILFWLSPHWDAFDRLLLVKGQRWVEERGEARHRGLMNAIELRKVAGYETRGNDAESVVLCLRREQMEG